MQPKMPLHLIKECHTLCNIAESVPSLPQAATALKHPRHRQALASDAHPLAQSEASLLPIRDRRPPNPSTASLFRSTLTPPGSRSGSPAPSVLAGSVFGGGSAGLGKSLLENGTDSPSDPLNLILKSLVPHIAIYGSQDVDELVGEKGFGGGGCGSYYGRLGKRSRGR